MDATFHGGSNDIIDGRGRLRRPEISPFRFEVVLVASGASDQVCEVSMDAPFHGGSNDIIDKD
jgi:hypothetical protein